ncbi:MAG TPA: SAM-dependent methyltransferase [Actinopolymorphaceae bacterium]
MMQQNITDPSEGIDPASVPPGVDPNQTNAARLYSLFINPTEGQFFPIDVAVSKQIEAAIPESFDIAQDNRVFVRRAARFMVNQGIKQIIDLGSGLPADQNTHEVVHAIDADVRVIYDDIDPMTVAHAEHLLRGASNVAYIGEDARDVDAVLGHPRTRELIDLAQPVGFILGSIMQLWGPDCDSHAVVRRYLDAVPSGSYLAVSHFTTPGQRPPHDGPPADRVKALSTVMEAAGEPLIFRTPEEIRRYFDGLELVPPYDGVDEPDLVWVNRWGAKDPAQAYASGCWLLAGVARKP